MATPTNTTPPWKSYMATGNATDIVASTTVAAAIGLKVDATSGQSLNQTLQTPTITGGSMTAITSTITGGSASRSINDKLADYISVKDFGAVGDGTTDDTTAIQNAINYCQTNNKILHIPSGVFNITATLVISECLEITGVFPSPNHDRTTPNNVPTMGTWLYFNHLNKGIQVASSSIGWLGVRLNNFGTCRPQNTDFSSSSWAPFDIDYDISLEKSDDTIVDHIIMLNATKGIYTSSRSSLSYIYGNPLTQGIYADNVTDVLRISQIHFWAYWMTSTTTAPWTQQNFDAITLGRVDNPMLDNIFCYSARALLRCTTTTNGHASKVKLANADADASTHLLWLDTTATTGGIGVDMVNVSHQGDSTTKFNSRCIYIQSAGNQVSISNIRSDYNGAEFVRVEGTNNVVHVDSVDYVNFGSEVSANMFYAADTNVVDAKGFINYAPSTYSSSMFSSTGIFITDTWLSFTPTITSAQGAPNTVTSKVSYTRTAKSITIAGNITITDIGTAAGNMLVSLPKNVFSTAINFIGGAKEFTTGTQIMTCYALSGASNMTINGADGTTPWVNGHLIGFTLTYGTP